MALPLAAIISVITLLPMMEQLLIVRCCIGTVSPASGSLALNMTSETATIGSLQGFAIGVPSAVDLQYTVHVFVGV